MEPQASSWLGELWCWLKFHHEILRNLAFSLSVFLAATVGTILLIIRTIAVNRSSKAALKQSEISEQSQITERFSKAFELLGHKDVAVRLGAIYALERIARDSPRDHWTIMETLMAYTRRERDSVLDVQAVLVVISRRETSNDPPSVTIDLSKSYLKSVFAQRPQLPGAVMVQADLQGANLYEADLQGANLYEADLQRAMLMGANLEEANLQGAMLMGALLQKADLQRANLEGAMLMGALLQKADLQRADLSGTHLQGAHLQEANLQEAMLMGAKLQGANLYEADLQGVILHEAKLQGADLLRADLQGANLRRADLQGADLQRADLQGANLEGAYLRGADLRGAKNLGCDSLKLALSWQFAFRDPELACGAKIPKKYPE